MAACTFSTSPAWYVRASSSASPWYGTVREIALASSSTRVLTPTLFSFVQWTSLTNSGPEYGITQGTKTCLSGTKMCNNPDQYLYLDTLHPVTSVHKCVVLCS